MWTELRFGLASALLAAGLLVMCTGLLGTIRFRDTLQRLHAAAVNDTLGLLLIVCSLMLAEGWSFTSVKFLLVLVFLWIASPVSSHLIARCAYLSGDGKKEAHR